MEKIKLTIQPTIQRNEFHFNYQRTHRATCTKNKKLYNRKNLPRISYQKGIIVMLNDIENMLEIVTEENEELKNSYINAIPKKLIELKLLETIQMKLKQVKEELKVMVNVVGEFENDYFQIKKKETKTTKVNFTDLDNAIKEIAQNLPQNEEQIEIFKNLVETMKTDIEVKKPSEKLKLLEKINPSQAQQITRIEIKEELVLKEKEALKEELENNLKNKKEENPLLN